MNYNIIYILYNIHKYVKNGFRRRLQINYPVWLEWTNGNCI